MRKVISILFLILALTMAVESASAQVKRRAVSDRRVVRDLSDIFTPYSGIRNELNSLAVNPSETYLYDPLELAELRRLKDRAQPDLRIEEPDGAETRRISEKALSMQTARSFVKLLQGSDLKDGYEAFQESLKSLNDTFRYSLQDNGSGLVVSKGNKGKKLVEFKLEFNLRHGAEPNLAIGDSFRLRYDMKSHGPVAEYALNF